MLTDPIKQASSTFAGKRLCRRRRQRSRKETRHIARCFAIRLRPVSRGAPSRRLSRALAGRLVRLRRSRRRPQAALRLGEHLGDLLEQPQEGGRELRGAQLQVRLRRGEQAGRHRVSGGEQQPVHLLVERAGVRDGALKAESECTSRSVRHTTVASPAQSVRRLSAWHTSETARSTAPERDGTERR